MDSLNSNWQHLYVAVTRARNQLWLVESLEQMTDPIVNVFNRGAQQPLVEVVKPTDKDVRNPSPLLVNICHGNNTLRWRRSSRLFVKEDLPIPAVGPEGGMNS